jgi:outer membrane protein assembly factor BamB
MNPRPFSAICAGFLLALLPGLSRGADYAFEDLGEPMRVRGLGMQFVTHTADERYVAWGVYDAHNKSALVGVRLDNGEVTWVDLTRFGKSHVQAIQAADGNFYVYAGDPGHFLRYDVVQCKLVDLGMPAQPASYTLGHAVGPDGMFYVGTHPQACLVQCDPGSGRIKSFGRLSPDPRQWYALASAVGDDNVIYCAVGLHHRELWAVDASTGSKRQILPSSLTGAQGMPDVWLGVDGKVYGRSGDTIFRCHSDRIEIGQTKPSRSRPPLRAGDKIVGSINAKGELTLTDVKTGKVFRQPTGYEGSSRAIFSVSCERDGKIYGGTIFPAGSFCYDPRASQLTYLGRLTSAPIQVYDTLNHPAGLFLSSYMPASVDFFDPALPVKKPDNPRHVVTVAGQERPVQLALGPDGMVYTGTFPSKGRLGGALVRVNPISFSSKVWTNLIPKQSIFSLAAVPETGELFCTSSIEGGSSAIPTEKSAFVFLWDCQREQVVFRAQPVSGATRYGAVVHARNGLLYGVAGRNYYAFDPAQRKVVFTGALPVKSLRFPELSDEPAGPRGLIYGVGDDAVFAIDPADHGVRIVARDKSLGRAHGFFVTPDETLYYGAGTRLMRCRLAK